MTKIDKRYVTRKDICNAFGFSRFKLWRMIKEGKFERPTSADGRYWDEGVIDRFANARPITDKERALMGM